LRLHLDTAPVLEKMRAGGECPLCALKRENEASYVEYFLGGSVMEVATRKEVNQKGFCGKHLDQLFHGDNRLGLSLLESSHLKEIIQALKDRPAPKKSLFQKKDAPGPEEGCALCDRLENTMRRYALTVAALWEMEADFRLLLENSKGFCIPHYEMIRAEAPGALSGKSLTEFLAALDDVQVKNLERVLTEVDWFAKKHDYRYHDQPWGDSRDAVERCAKKLRGE
jgi:hypothetical protein